MPILLPPLTPDQAGWEEFYGPDYPYSWLGAGEPLDAPVLANSLARVRYDPATGTPGFTIDAWDTASTDTSTGGWVAQGKVLIQRNGDAGAVYPSLVSASVLEWTPDRTVVSVIMAAPADARSRERVLITLQRGWTGPRFEVYGPSKADGSPPVLAVQYHMVAGDPNCSVYKLDAGGMRIATTVASGSSLFSAVGVGVLVGDSTFTGENFLAVLREGANKQVNLAVVQEAATVKVASSTAAYGVATNMVEVLTGGYISAHVGYCTQASDQLLEAEAFRNASSATISQITDATASAGHAVLDTQASNAAATLTKVSNLAAGKYRILVRLQTGGSGGAVGNYQMLANGAGGLTFTGAAGPGWQWVDLNELTIPAGALYQLWSWNAHAGDNVWSDRIEAPLLEDRIGAVPGYAGARDLGRSVLYDQRVAARRVQRAA